MDTGSGSAPEDNDTDQRTERAADEPLTMPVAPSSATARKATSRTARRWRRGQIAQVSLSVLLAVVSIVVSGDMSGWSAAGLTGNLFAPQVTPSGTAVSATTQPDVKGALSRAVAMPTAPPTPTPPGEWTPAGGSWPGYTGPVSASQSCPSGKAPRPVSWVVGSAGGYGAPRLNTVALTFDDGPTPYSSPAILSFLESTHTPATFFVLGQYAKAFPWLLQREEADGFTIGVHTWSHPDMRLLTPAQRAWQLMATVQQIHADLGPSYCLWLWRPPYGSSNTSIVRQAGTFGLTTVTWNVDPQDWSRPGTMTIVSRVLAQVRPGSIILMHDGPAAREETAAALPYILDGLRARGLIPVSLPQLLMGYQPPAPSPTTTPDPTATPSPTVTPTSPAAATLAISDRREAWLAPAASSSF